MSQAIKRGRIATIGSESKASCGCCSTFLATPSLKTCLRICRRITQAYTIYFKANRLEAST